MHYIWYSITSSFDFVFITYLYTVLREIFARKNFAKASANVLHKNSSDLISPYEHTVKF